jgi:hypothetical protein
MIDTKKLKREWKTAAVGAAGVVVEGYDALVYSGSLDLPALVPEEHRAWVSPAILVLMLLLRKWKDNVVPSVDTESAEQSVSKQDRRRPTSKGRS